MIEQLLHSYPILKYIPLIPVINILGFIVTDRIIDNIQKNNPEESNLIVLILMSLLKVLNQASRLGISLKFNLLLLPFNLFNLFNIDKPIVLRYMTLFKVKARFKITYPFFSKHLAKIIKQSFGKKMDQNHLDVYLKAISNQVNDWQKCYDEGCPNEVLDISHYIDEMMNETKKIHL